MKLPRKMIALLLLFLPAASPASDGGQSSPANVPTPQSLFLLSDARSHSIGPENPTGGKGGGSHATLDNGSDAAAARELGTGWKVNPFIRIRAGTTSTLAEFSGSGIINHIWMTLGDEAEYRSAILRIYWDDEKTPSVEVPAGDFFNAGWGRGHEPIINSAMIAVNPRSGFNSFWQMPFRKHFRITLENRSTKPLVLYYEVSFSEQAVPANAAYFHAEFRKVDRLETKQVFTIVDGIKGEGQYVGTALSHGARSPGWWGEGEVKFYVDGDEGFPTINSTGEEDYFLGSYGYTYPFGKSPNGEVTYYRTQPYSSYYAGFTEDESDSGMRKISEYRWHVMDPIRFKHDLKVTLQGLGWRTDVQHTYLPLNDYYAAVAYWYQTEPHAPFPALPSDAELQVK